MTWPFSTGESTPNGPDMSAEDPKLATIIHTDHQQHHETASEDGAVLVDSLTLFPNNLSPTKSTKMTKSTFKQSHDFERRRAEASRIREKYPDRIPVIVEKSERSDIPNIDKKKYLVPADLTVGQFVYVIRKRIKLSAEKAIFIFVGDILPPTGAVMSTIYDDKKDVDGFLYVSYSGENTFG